MTAEEFCKNNLDDIHGMSRDVIESHIKFAAMHVEKALKAALEEVPYGGSDAIHYEDVVGILTCYPLSNIK